MLGDEQLEKTMEQGSGEYPQLPPRPSDTDLVAQYSRDLGGVKQAIEQSLHQVHDSLANRVMGLSDDLKTLTSFVQQNQGRGNQGVSFFPLPFADVQLWKLLRLRDYS